MPENLKRYYGLGHLHFITFSCHQRLALLGSAQSRDAFVQALDEVRRDCVFFVVGYVVMPEHVHLLIGEPRAGSSLSTVIQSVKLRVSKRMRRTEPAVVRFWLPRFYDFNVYSAKKRREKLEYMHRNPVTRGIVKGPEDWVWSSYSSYSGRGTPLLSIDLVE